MSILEAIKRFFISLMFWRKKPEPQIEQPREEIPEQSTKEPEIELPTEPIENPEPDNGHIPIEVDDSEPDKPQPKEEEQEDEPTDDGEGGEIEVPTRDLPLNDKYPLHYRIAYGEIGVREVRGPNHNPRVLEYHDTTGDFSDDETPWCASFVNWCLIEPYWNEEQGAYITGGLAFPRTPKQMQLFAKMIGSGKANARSLLTAGNKVEEKDVRIGDIVVLWRGREKGWQGHVGFVAGLVGDQVKILGGNQANAVNIRNYPKSRVLGYRRIEY